jgi:hypothetical protein
VVWHGLCAEVGLFAPFQRGNSTLWREHCSLFRGPVCGRYEIVKTSCGAPAARQAIRTEEFAMQLLDEMLALNLLTPEQHHEIAVWVGGSKTPDKIMQMPPHLWRALELASVLMDFDVPVSGPMH